jgi:hypothetical protein
MADIINLNHKRKQKRRSEAETLAVSNRQKFGRTKTEKQLDKLEAVQASQKLDGHKRDKP